MLLKAIRIPPVAPLSDTSQPYATRSSTEVRTKNPTSRPPRFPGRPTHRFCAWIFCPRISTKSCKGKTTRKEIPAPGIDHRSTIGQLNLHLPRHQHVAAACGDFVPETSSPIPKPDPHRPHFFPATCFRPRRLAFPAAFAGSFVTLRSATRDTEASARSNTSMISARFRSRSCHISSASRTTSSAPRNRPLSMACRTNASCSGLSRTSMPLSLKVTTAPVKHPLLRMHSRAKPHRGFEPSKPTFSPSFAPSRFCEAKGSACA
jgi:hypothetical protein